MKNTRSVFKGIFYYKDHVLTLWVFVTNSVDQYSIIQSRSGSTVEVSINLYVYMCRIRSYKLRFNLNHKTLKILEMFTKNLYVEDDTLRTDTNSRWLMSSFNKVLFLIWLFTFVFVIFVKTYVLVMITEKHRDKSYILCTCL